MTTILERVLPFRSKKRTAASRSMRVANGFPALVEPHRTGKRGRPPFLPVFVECINSTPEGVPTILKTGGCAGLYHHRRILREAGFESMILSPNTRREINGHTITNISEDKFILVGVGTHKETYTPMSVNIQVV